jgi:hypothetical protein
MTRYSSGYPYLIQLMGYLVFEAAAPGRKATMPIIEDAFVTARKEMARAIHQPVISSLSGKDVDYLRAMAKDEGPSQSADVAARMQVNPSYASSYRKRLLEAGVIMSPTRGAVDFAVPLLRDYLKDNRTSRIQYGFEDYTSYGR